SGPRACAPRATGAACTGACGPCPTRSTCCSRCWWRPPAATSTSGGERAHAPGGGLPRPRPAAPGRDPGAGAPPHPAHRIFVALDRRLPHHHRAHPALRAPRGAHGTGGSSRPHLHPVLPLHPLSRPALPPLLHPHLAPHPPREGPGAGGRVAAVAPGGAGRLAGGFHRDEVRVQVAEVGGEPRARLSGGDAVSAQERNAVALEGFVPELLELAGRER